MTLEGLRRFAQAIRAGDWTGAAMMAGRPLGIVRFDRMLILETAATAGSQMTRGGGREPDVLLRQAGTADLATLHRVFPHGAPRYAGRFERGDECLIAETAGVPIAMTWVGSDRDAPMEIGCRIHLPEGGWWEYDVFVLQEHRGRGLFAILMRGLFERVASRGGTRLFAAVSHLNRVSLAAHQRHGYRTAAVLDRFVLAGRPRHRVTWPDGTRSRLACPRGGSPELRLP